MCWRCFDRLKVATNFESKAFANDRAMTTWFENWTNSAKGSSGRRRLSEFQFLVWRIAFFIFGMGGIAFLFAVTLDEGVDRAKYNYIFLTNWTFTIETIYAGLALYVLVMEPGRGNPSIPTIIKITWILRNICICTPFLITIVYWTLLFPDAEGDHHVPKLPLAMTLHGLNSVLMILELYFTKVPILVMHVYMPFLYAAIYLIWAVIHFELKIGNPYGDRLIYPILNFYSDHLLVTICLCAVLFISIIFLYLLIAYIKMDLQHLHRFKQSQSAGFLVNSILNS